MTIFEYLANASKNRLFDKPFIRWYQGVYGVANVKKKKDEWEKIYSAFLSETETKPHIPVVTPIQKESIPEKTETTISKGDK